MGPDLFLVLLVAGILLVYVECNRPGWVLPGCLGTLLVLLSGYALARWHTAVHIHLVTALVCGTVLGVCSTGLGRLARLAWKNKRTQDSPWTA